MVSASPVRGLRPDLSGRSRRSKVPNPATVTFSPLVIWRSIFFFFARLGEVSRREWTVAGWGGKGVGGVEGENRKTEGVAVFDRKACVSIEAFESVALLHPHLRGDEIERCAHGGLGLLHREP